MKKWLIISIGILILGIGGFFLVKEWATTGVPALDHDFTSDFINDEADTGTDGFYLFESGTGQFQMHFPGEFEMYDRTGRYSIAGDRFELFNAQKVRENENDGITSIFQVTYNGEFNAWEKELNFERLLEDFSYESQYDSFETDDVYGYFGESIGKLIDREVQIFDPDEGETNRYFAFVLDKHSDRVVTVTYRLVCGNNPENCVINEEENAALFTHMIKSIQFNNNEGK
ncbi:hypothetical protein HUG15_15970 [Salicibibacter cibarius]|uniref:Uncharacterized protein n=1 Tax=Salicibibacter cibarius TaxID=2743000 RepID=A0A7T6Z567_9BACI|nr:hypothetical protein [Salicibibacter cibarius]QQK76917.1 hypothetical protein HUG15_15970 [Salicibibacter cibarius]